MTNNTQPAEHKLYFTDHNQPLLATEVMDKPVITLENYEKWYGLYLLHPDGRVTRIDSVAVDMAYERCVAQRAPIRDHCYHPEIMYRLADLIDAYVHPQSAEVALGRWMLEIEELDFYQSL